MFSWNVGAVKVHASSNSPKGPAKTLSPSGYHSPASFHKNDHSPDRKSRLAQPCKRGLDEDAGPLP